MQPTERSFDTEHEQFSTIKSESHVQLFIVNISAFFLITTSKFGFHLNHWKKEFNVPLVDNIFRFDQKIL